MIERPYENAFRLRLSDRQWLVFGTLLALAPFLTTLETAINGSNSPFATDTGEIQNAVPRWGTLHGIGYPQYTMTGALMVTLVRLIGIPPAMGASLVSTFWAAIALGLLILLARELGALPPAAVVGAWFVALSTSVWMDASLAEIHTLTLTLTLGTLLFALRFGRSGARRDLLWLSFCFTQGVIHQRSLLLIGPAVAILAAPGWRAAIRHLCAVIGVGTLAPLTYLYIWIRIRMQGDWIFQPDFGKVIADNQAERLVHLPTVPDEWLLRLERLLDVLNDDLPLLLIGVGLAGLLLLPWSHSRREAVGLALGWLPSFGLGLLVWEGRISDSLLAAKLPIVAVAGVGLALVMGWAWTRLTGMRRGRAVSAAGSLLLAALLVVLGCRHYPKITAVTRDPRGEQLIRMVEQVAPPPDGRPASLVALWGNQYWQLSYAQTYQGRLPGLNLVKHYANLLQCIEAQGWLWIPSETFTVYSISYWERRVGQRVALACIAPGIIQLTAAPQTELAGVPAGPTLDLKNGIRIASAALEPGSEGQLVLSVVWQATTAPARDYAVVLELLAHDPLRDTADIVARAGYAHPVEGWYPTSRWSAGEYVTDHYRIAIPAGAEPVAVRITLYSPTAGLPRDSSRWLSLPVPSNQASAPGPDREP